MLCYPERLSFIYLSRLPHKRPSLRIDSSYLVTQVLKKYSLLVLLVSVYENLSKNSFFLCFKLVFERKRMQRYALLRYHPNFSAIIFQKTIKFSRLFTKKGALHLNIYSAPYIFRLITAKINRVLNPIFARDTRTD